MADIFTPHRNSAITGFPKKRGCFTKKIHMWDVGQVSEKKVGVVETEHQNIFLVGKGREGKGSKVVSRKIRH